MPPTHARYRWLRLATLVLAGEAIFFLPFVIARVFRPTLLEVFGISNLELGMAFSAYGIVAMLSYFLGGPLAVFCYAWLLGAPQDELSIDDRRQAFQQIILLFTAVTLLTAALIWFAMPSGEVRAPASSWRATARGLRDAAAMPIVWVQSLIIICAYVAYKGLDDVSLYARDALGVDEVTAAYTGTVSMWMRPLGAIGSTPRNAFSQ